MGGVKAANCELVDVKGPVHAVVVRALMIVFKERGFLSGPFGFPLLTSYYIIFSCLGPLFELVAIVVIVFLCLYFLFVRLKYDMCCLVYPFVGRWPVTMEGVCVWNLDRCYKV